MSETIPVDSEKTKQILSEGNPKIGLRLWVGRVLMLIGTLGVVNGMRLARDIDLSMEASWWGTLGFLVFVAGRRIGDKAYSKIQHIKELKGK